MRCALQSLSFQASLTRGFRRMDRVAKQHAEGVLVFLSLGQIGYGGTHRLCTVLDSLTELAVGHDVQLVVENALQHALPDGFARHVQVREVASLLTPLVRLGITGR